MKIWKGSHFQKKLWWFYDI